MEKALNSFLAVKRASKDNKDGLVLLQLRCKPADIPPEIKFGNYGDRYLLSVRPVEVGQFTPTTFEGQRVSLDDLGDGAVNLKVAALPAQVGDGVLYAQNGTLFEIAFEPVFGGSAIVPITPDHRRATFRRLQVLLTEPPFWSFLERQDRWGLLHQNLIQDAERRDFALEVFYRLTQSHSRSDILTNAAVCERSERLIRTYRNEQWHAQSIQNARPAVPYPLRIIAT